MADKGKSTSKMSPSNGKKNKNVDSKQKKKSHLSGKYVKPLTKILREGTIDKDRSTSTMLPSTEKNNKNVDSKLNEKAYRRGKFTKPLSEILGENMTNKGRSTSTMLPSTGKNNQNVDSKQNEKAYRSGKCAENLSEIMREGMRINRIMMDKRKSTSTTLTSTGKNNQNVDSKRKEKAHRREKCVKPLTKVVIRKLPPTMTEEEFLKQIAPLPEHESYYFVPADWSLGFDSTSRAYINFVNQDDIYLFKDRFDGYVFVDQKGVEYPAIVEFAPFQGLPRKCRKKDPKCNTVETDPHYLNFLEKVDKENNEPRTESKLEYSYQIKSDKKITSTPLLQYLASRKQEKKDLRQQKIDQKRRQRDDERKKKRVQIAKSIPPPIKEEETKVSILKNYPKERNNRDRGFDRRDKGKFDDVRKEKRHLESDQKRKNDDRIFQNQNRTSRRLQNRKFEQNKDDIQNSSSTLIKTNQNQKNSDINKYTGNNTNKNTFDNKSKKIYESNVKDNKSEKYKTDNLKERKNRKLSSGSDEISDNVREFFMNVANVGSSSSVKKSNSSSSLSSTTFKTTFTSKQDSHGHSSKSNTTNKYQDETTQREKNYTVKNDNTRKYENRNKSDDVNKEERSARRIRNKDRPSIEIYQPGKMRLNAKKDENNSSNLSDMKYNRSYSNENKEKDDGGGVRKKVSKYSERRLNRAKEREQQLNNSEMTLNTLTEVKND